MQGVGNAIRIFFVFHFEKLILIVSRNETCHGVGLGNDILHVIVYLLYNGYHDRLSSQSDLTSTACFLSHENQPGFAVR